MLDFNWQKTDVFAVSETVYSDWLSEVCVLEDRILREVSVVFVSDEGLLEMNKEYLMHDYYTDIITFDYCEEDDVIGDLFISVDRVKENAHDHKATFDQEMSRVLVHGVLHLCGYGDKSEDEERTIREKENFYLNKLKGFT
jgi:rRNA maturation RNase YbeY